jgi:transcription termination/antitermination protein NusA
MKNDFLLAIAQLAGEKNLSKEVVFEAVEAALASAYRRDQSQPGPVVVKIDPNTGAAHFYAQKTVVTEVEDPRVELTVKEARAYSPSAAVGEIVDIEIAAQPNGRIAAQTAKQVVLQKLREAEREVVFEEYAGREGDILSGIVQRIEGSGNHKSIFIDLGKTEAVLPANEQVRTEHYQQGQRLKVYVIEVHKATKGPQVIVSRSHKNLIKRLFELEVPEIFRGAVEIKSIAREAGYRSKVAVTAKQENVDPVGACVGLRGIRIQNVVNELNGERIDVVQWDPDNSRFVANALSPAQVVTVTTDEEDNTASVVVPDRQLSLAIGKEGQNARLAAKLTGWRIDIRNQTTAEAERAAQMPPEPAVVAEPGPGVDREEIHRSTPLAPAASIPEAVPFEVDGREIEMPEPMGRPEPLVTVVPPAAVLPRPTGGLRFAEDLNIAPLAAPVRPEGTKSSKKHKAKKGSDRDELDLSEPVKAKKDKRGRVDEVEEEEYDEYQYLTKKR